MKNSCLISKQNTAISPTKFQTRRLTLNQLSNVSGLINFPITLNKIATVTLNLFLVLCFSRQILLNIKLKRHPSHQLYIFKVNHYSEEYFKVPQLESSPAKTQAEICLSVSKERKSKSEKKKYFRLSLPAALSINDMRGLIKRVKNENKKKCRIG